jgi:LysM repeat protein
MKQQILIVLLCLAALAALPAAAQEAEPIAAQGAATHLVAPGDTWAALALRYGASREALQAANPHPNPYRQPVIGAAIQLPPGVTERSGALARPEGSLLRLALENRPESLGAGRSQRGSPSLSPAVLPGDLPAG